MTNLPAAATRPPEFTRDRVTPGAATAATGLPTPGLVAMALAFLPLVAVHLRLLGGRAYYEFIPLVPAGSLFLAWGPCRWLGGLRPGPPRASAWLLGGSAALLGVAAVLSSPLLGMVAALAGAAAAAYDLGGRALARALLPAWAFLWLTVPLPMGFDRPLIAALQETTTQLAGPLLDGLGLMHMTEGYVINVGGHRLLIEEACSGVNSLFVVLAAVLFFALWSRYSALRGAVLLASAAVFTLSGNVARVASVALFEARWGIDVGHGWKHEALGMAACLIAFALVLSADQIYEFFASAGRFEWLPPPVPFEDLRGADDNDPASVDVPPAPVPAAEVAETSFPAAAARPRLASRWWAAGFGAIAALVWAWVLPVSVEFLVPVRTAPYLASLAALTYDDMPERFGDYRRLKSSDARGLRSEVSGKQSRYWQYQIGRRNATISVDSPFTDWHDLRLCYRDIGWKVKESNLRAPAGPGGEPYFETTLEGPTGRHALLLFSCHGERPHEADPPDHARAAEPASADQGVASRILSRFKVDLGTGARVPSVKAGKVYQVQLFLEGVTPITGADRAEARALFENARVVVRGKIAAGSKGVTP